MRRLLLLAVVVGSQLAAGCYCYRPYLPRLHSGFGCAGGTCGGSLLGGPGLRGVVPPVGTGVPVGTDPGYGGSPVGGAPGCVGCGSGPGVSAGYPLAADGYPSAAAMPYGSATAPMPILLPTAMPGGIPHDSALLKMPTIMPPGPPSTSKRPEELAREITGRR